MTFVPEGNLLFSALVIALLLEYLDFRSGRQSFIFEKIFRLDQTAVADINQKLILLLEKNQYTYSFFKDESDLFHYRLEIKKENFADFFRQLNRFFSDYKYRLQIKEKEQLKDEELLLLEVYAGSQKRFILLLHLKIMRFKESKPESGPERKEKKESPVVKPLPKSLPQPGGVPRVAILIDDLGYSPLVTATLKELQIPLSVAIIPTTTYSRQEAENANKYGFEILIHLPMQAKNGNGYDSRLQFIKSGLSQNEIENIISATLREIPYARGVNNHTGSLATASKELMQKTLAAIKRHKLFFIDSRTSAESVAFSVAREMGVRSYRRDIFLDGNPTYTNVVQAMTRLVNVALQNGKALAIGHPFQTTIDALKDVIPLYKDRVRFVFVSNLLE